MPGSRKLSGERPSQSKQRAILCSVEVRNCSAQLLTTVVRGNTYLFALRSSFHDKPRVIALNFFTTSFFVDFVFVSIYYENTL